MEQRVIKFRAWDKTAEVMFYQEKQGSEEGSALVRWLVDFPGYYNVMQFAGLTDKNGREIYEGDIVYGLSNDMTYSTWAVAYESVNEDWTGFNIGVYEADEVEVIGNIHENPELLKR